MTVHHFPHRFFREACALVMLTGAAHAMAPEPPSPNGGAPPGNGGERGSEDLTQLSLEELMGIKVTVASGTEQRLSDVPAAAYVLTGDEIRRSGHSSIPEALRMVPGFHVSRWNGDMWDVTARGYGNNLSLTNEAFLNQLLVMLDGVPLYSPLFGGVWWGLLDIPMEDVERIEVIRGPGGIVWGSNTVHGVVNIVTKKSSDTIGGLVSTWYGAEDQHYVVRGGMPFGKTGSLRLWGKQSEYDSLRHPYGGYRNDWDLTSGGFRADWGNPEGWNYHSWGRYYEGKFQSIAFDLMTFDPFSSNNNKSGFQAAISANHAPTGDTFTAWIQRDRQDLRTLVDIDIDQVDIEYKREIEVTDSSHVNIGLGFRQIDSRLRGDDPLYEDFSPRHFTQNNSRLFVVDTIDFESINSQLVLGLQLEHNEFTGFEFMPSIRGSVRPIEELLMWAGISRAVRTPSLEEFNLSQNSVIVGNKNLESEELIAYEAGARWQPCEEVAIDFATFFNRYDELQNTTFDPNTFQSQLGNTAEGRGYGYEFAVDLKPTDRWSIRSTYSRLGEKFNALSGSDPVIADRYAPEKLLSIRSYFDVCESVEFDMGLYMVGDLEAPFDDAEYKRGDARLGWRPSSAVEFAIGVIGFADPVRDEYTDFAAPNNEIRRQAYVSFTWTPWQREVE